MQAAFSVPGFRDVLASRIDTTGNPLYSLSMRKRLWTKADIVLIGLILISAGLLLGFSVRKGSAAFQQPYLEVSVGRQVTGIYPLHEDRRIELEEGNVFVIRDGQVSMESADCPDQICVHSKAIGQEGGSIVCLPHQVILRIVDGVPSGSGVDSVAE